MMKPNKTKNRSVGLQIFLIIIPILSSFIIALVGGIVSEIVGSENLFYMMIGVATWVSIPLSLLSLWAFWRVGRLIKGVILNVVFNISMKFAERTSEELSYIILIIYIIVMIALIVKWTRRWNDRTEESEAKADDESDEKEKESQR